MQSLAEDEERRRIRRERNKLAAARCRQRRVDLTNQLLAVRHRRRRYVMLSNVYTVRFNFSRKSHTVKTGKPSSEVAPFTSAQRAPVYIYTHTRLTAIFRDYRVSRYQKGTRSSATPRDRAMRLVSSNLANYHATVQKLLIRQVLTKPMV